MPLSAGDKLGPYEIAAPIGAGGMGEVYRAHDSRLKRDVAIKVSNASSPSVLPAKPVRLRLSTTPTSAISATLDPTIWSWSITRPSVVTSALER